MSERADRDELLARCRAIKAALNAEARAVVKRAGVTLHPRIAAARTKPEQGDGR